MQIINKFTFFLTLILIIFSASYSFSHDGINKNHEIVEYKNEQSVITKIKLKILEINKYINKKIPEKLSEFNKNKNISTLVSSLALAFMYGFFHTVGPGHGKTVVTNYFLTRKTQLYKCLHVGFLIGFFHVISSIALIFIFDIVISQIYKGTPNEQINIIKIISYCLILIIGIYLLIQSLIRYFSKNKTNHSSCKNCEINNNEQTALSFSIGIVPCVGSLIVLLYSMANGILLFGVAMVAFIAIGMGFALTMFGIVAYYSREKLLNIFEKENKIISTIIEILGNIALILIAIISLYVYI